MFGEAAKLLESVALERKQRVAISVGEYGTMPTQQHIVAVAQSLKLANTDADFCCGVSLLQAALAAEVAPLPTQVEAAASALLAASAGKPLQQAGIAALAVGCGAVEPATMGRWLARYRTESSATIYAQRSTA